MNEIIKDIQGDIPWCMLFADDVVLVDETMVDVNRTLELWRQTLEYKGFLLSRTKTEYRGCDFSGVGCEKGNDSLEGQIVPTRNKFWYLRIITGPYRSSLKLLVHGTFGRSGTMRSLTECSQISPPGKGSLPRI
jgi:hypothetical protein